MGPGQEEISIDAKTRDSQAWIFFAIDLKINCRKAENGNYFHAAARTLALRTCSSLFAIRATQNVFLRLKRARIIKGLCRDLAFLLLFSVSLQNYVKAVMVRRTAATTSSNGTL